MRESRGEKGREKKKTSRAGVWGWEGVFLHFVQFRNKLEQLCISALRVEPILLVMIREERQSGCGWKTDRSSTKHKGGWTF